jgi:hypothetical protein
MNYIGRGGLQPVKWVLGCRRLKQARNLRSKSLIAAGANKKELDRIPTEMHVRKLTVEISVKE